MSESADIADAIIALDTALKNFERAFPDRNMQKLSEWHALKDAIEVMQETSLGEGQHFESLEEARQFRAPRCWGTNSKFRNYKTGQDEFHTPTCGNTEPHDFHII